MADFTFKISGLKELQARYSENKLSKELVSAVGSITLDLHNILNSKVQERYATNRSLNSVLSSPISKRSANFIGSKILEGSLSYQHEQLNIGFWPNHNSYWGNLKPREDKPRQVWGTKRKGLVQRVMIIRKNGYKEVYGQTGYGGFRPGLTSRWIIERTGPHRRAETKLVYTPSLAQMANTVYRTDKSIKSFTSTIGQRILKELRL